MNEHLLIFRLVSLPKHIYIPIILQRTSVEVTSFSGLAKFCSDFEKKIALGRVDQTGIYIMKIF